MVLPASASSGSRGAPVDITSEFMALTLAQYQAIEVQRVAANIAISWTDSPEYACVGMTVSAPGVGTQGRIATFLGPAVADLVSVVAAVLPSNVALTIIANSIDYARKLQVRIVTGSTAGTLTLVGVGVDGEAVTQAIDISTTGGTRTVVTTNAYRSLTSATITGGSGFAGTVGIGLGLGLALPSAQASVSSFSVFGENCDKVNTAVGTVDTVARTVEPTTAANGTHNYTWQYKFTVTPAASAYAKTPIVVNSVEYAVSIVSHGVYRFTPSNQLATFLRQTFTDATRPVPTEKTLPAGFAIWNTDDNAWNYSGGDLGVWFNALGVIT